VSQELQELQGFTPLFKSWLLMAYFIILISQ